MGWPVSFPEVIPVALYNPARISVVADLQRQEPLAAARHEHLCDLATAGEEIPAPPSVVPRRFGTPRSVLATVRMPPFRRFGRWAAPAGRA